MFHGPGFFFRRLKELNYGTLMARSSICMPVSVFSSSYLSIISLDWLVRWLVRFTTSTSLFKDQEFILLDFVVFLLAPRSVILNSLCIKMGWPITLSADLFVIHYV